jgi:hypothetical protein
LSLADEMDAEKEKEQRFSHDGHLVSESNPLSGGILSVHGIGLRDRIGVPGNLHQDSVDAGFQGFIVRVSA